MFFYDSFFNQALAALGGTALTSVQTVSYMILGITFLLSVYEAFARGGDTRQLMVGFLKYVIAAVVIQNWSAVFNDIHTGIESIAWAITSQDYVSLWQSNFVAFMQQNPNPATAGIAAGIANLAQDIVTLAIDVIFGVSLIIFDFIYALWGCVLFLLAPLLIATVPSVNLAGFGKKFLAGLAEWCMWPVLYAVFALMAYNMNSANITSILADKNYTDIVSGTSNMLIISMMSLVIALCLLIIPFLAHFLFGASFDGVAATFVAMSRMMGGNVAALASAGGGGASGGGMGGGGGPSSSGGSGPVQGGSNEVSNARQTTNTTSTPPPATSNLPAAGSDLMKNMNEIKELG
ncbi:MAG: hypothetical protein ACP5EP_09630 [Acidobacteriaceae bacterium]